MNEIYERIAAGMFYFLSLFGNPCQYNFNQPVVNQVAVKQDSVVKTDNKDAASKTEKKQEIAVLKYSGEKKVKNVQEPAEIRISRQGELERLVEKKGGRDSLERETGYKLMLPLDSFQDCLLGRFYNEGSQGDLWIYGEKPVRLTASEEARESACIIPRDKDNFGVYWIEDSSSPASSSPDSQKQVYCEYFKVREGKLEKNGRKVYALPQNMKGLDIAYDSKTKELVLYLGSDKNKGAYVVPLSELAGDNPKMYQPVKAPEENSGEKK